MLKQMKDKTKLQKGFTIIEVMIVLAIAGLILVVVLIAIPQLQRNQRNTARQANMSRITAEIGNYAGNNNGKIPSSATEMNSFLTRYLGDVNYEDPSTGANMPIIVNDPLIIDGQVPLLNDDTAEVTIDSGVDGVAGNGDDFPEVSGGGNLGVAYYSTEFQCEGESVSEVPGGNRNFVMITVLEGGAIYCLDNK